MEHFPSNWGRPRDDIYGAYDHAIHNAGATPIKHTTQPMITGSSVVGVKFNGGVIIAADMLASAGSRRAFTDEVRVQSVGSETIVGIGGDVSDMQSLQQVLDTMEIDDAYDSPNYTLTAPSIHSYLRHLLYARRSKMNPLWSSILVGGFKDDKPFLGYVNLLGVSYEAPALATGFGSYLAVPILRKLVYDDSDIENVTEEQARAVINDCMKVLFYRDARAIDRYSIAVVTKEGVRVEKDIELQNASWRFAKDIKGFGMDRS